MVKFSIGNLARHVLDMFQIMRVRRAGRKSNTENFIPIQGVPVENIGSLDLNETILTRIEERWGNLDLQFEALITMTAEALKAVGKHIDTDIYLERRLLEGAREKDAHRGFLVERKEVDRALLMMIFDRNKIEQLDSSAKYHVEDITFSPMESSRKKGTGSVLDETYSSECIRQAEYYFNLLFQENSIIHILSETRKIVKILRLPYELPNTVYSRTVYPSRSPFCLTEILLPQMVKEDTPS